MDQAALADLLEEVRDRHWEVKTAFYARNADRRVALFDAVRRARERYLDWTFARQGITSGLPSPLGTLYGLIRTYAARSDWALLDVITLASCLELPVDAVAGALARPAQVYQGLRMLDDFIDRHRDYKGGLPTLFGEVQSRFEEPSAEAASNLLPIILMLMADDSLCSAATRRYASQTVAGMLDEALSRDLETIPRYKAMTKKKMVAYGSLLYEPVVALWDAVIMPELRKFLCRSFYVSQMLNDLHDRDDDRQRGQANFWDLAGEDCAMLVAHFSMETMLLSTQARRIHASARQYARSRVADLAAYGLQSLQREGGRATADGRPGKGPAYVR